MALVKPYDVDEGEDVEDMITTPAPQIGDAVHYEPSNGLFYRADPLVRRNVVGVLNGEGNLVRLGEAGGLTGLTQFSQYYLKWPSLSMIRSQSFDNVSHPIRSALTQIFRSTSFVGVAGKAPGYVEMVLFKTLSPAGYDIWIEIRPDDGTGKPSSTVLATSESIGVEDLGGGYTSADINATRFNFYNSFIMTGATYHLCICHDNPTGTIDSNYFQVRANSASSGHCRYNQNTGLWVADSGGLTYWLYAYNTDSIAGNNIVATHPFDTTGYDLRAMKVMTPVVKIGRAWSDTQLDVSIHKPQTIGFYRNISTIVAGSPGTWGYTKIGDVLTYGIEKIGILWRMKCDVGQAEAKPFWGGAVKPDAWGSDQRYYGRSSPYMETFDAPVNGKISLGLWLRGTGGGTAHAKYFEVIGG